MVQVIVRDGEPLEKAIRRFKKKYEKAGIAKAVKSHEYYLKPSAKRKLAKAKRREH